MMQILEEKGLGQWKEESWLVFLYFFGGNDEMLVCEDNSSVEGALGCFRKIRGEKRLGVLEEGKEGGICWGKEVPLLDYLQLHFIPCFLLYFRWSVEYINLGIRVVRDKK